MIAPIKENGMAILAKEMGFERHNFLVRIVRLPVMWFLGILPAKISHKLLVVSKDARQISRWAKTHKALEIIYSFPERRKKKEVSLGDIFWQTFSSNARAVRNRLRLVKQLLRSLVIERSEEVKLVQILSLGSGSGRALFEMIASLNGEFPVKATLIDRSRSAIEFSQELSKEIIGDREQDNFQWICAKTENLSDFLTNSSTDIVEMVGLLDYFSDREAIELFRVVYQCLSLNGWFVVSNTMPNIEEPFIAKGVGWPLVYRTPNQLKELLVKGGFLEEDVVVLIEPLKIHTIAIAQRI